MDRFDRAAHPSQMGSSMATIGVLFRKAENRPTWTRAWAALRIRLAQRIRLNQNPAQPGAYRATRLQAVPPGGGSVPPGCP